ncbi:MAG TPA: NAD-glutamate dehydrogenase [Rhizomicrobium sp.]|nr:NAD-glutamate dehydrogenase [Rhizomicrobium sp.]
MIPDVRAETANTPAVADPFDTEAAERIAAATALLKQAPQGLKQFFSAFFQGASPEDVCHFAPEALVALAEWIYAQTATRKTGEPLVILTESPVEPRNESVLLAVNDDMPFLLDSLIGEMSARGHRIHALFHPIMTVTRDANGARGDKGAAGRESVIVLALDQIVEPELRAEMTDGVRHVYRQVRLAVRDWHKMRERLHETVAGLKRTPPPGNREKVQESIAFLEWLGANHFTFLGSRDYAFRGGEDAQLDPIDESGLGVLSDTGARVVRRNEGETKLSREARDFLLAAEPLIITKSNERSVVHRRVHMDYIGVRMFDAKGKLTGERRFVGLFTSGAYSRRPGDIPMLRLKFQHVLQRAGLPSDSHDGKALAHILDAYPRDEMFQVSEDELFATALGILRLGERPKVRVFLRYDRFDRFVSAFVFMPRDRYTTEVREKVHAILAKAFHGRPSASNPTIDDSLLARIHYIVGRSDGPRPEVDIAGLEAEIREAIRTWDDGLSEALMNAKGDEEGARLFRRYAGAFPPRYRDVFSPDEAVRDLDELMRLSQQKARPIKARAYRSDGDERGFLRLKLYVVGAVLPLSASLPVFENLGFRVIAEDSYAIVLPSEEGPPAAAAVLDFLMERADQSPVSLAEIKAPLEEAFHAVVSGEAESDGFNRLVVGADLGWREVSVLRTIAKFLRQAGIAFSQDYMEQALARNPDIAKLMVELFLARSAPEIEDRDARVKALGERIDAALNDVPSLDDDRIIRRFRNVVEAMLRTNYHQADAKGAPSPYIAIKLDSQKVDELPAPRPHVEIFIYAPQVEGVHLRFGKVARGGIRWSDRREDFRTEVLGLVKAQQVKNAVIIPVGAKGGFYPKQLPVNATREAVQDAAIAAYQKFIHALLDLTDNILPDGTVMPPERVVRHDDDDPYLVVAADKGTATFSDIANAIAESRGFWLGDAFASGGSHGYDHKKMGITARGAWEAVKRHFREEAVDIQKEPFTVVGVGDMSGDVFGNGMLLSKETKLVAAFDHRHIFIDPTPNMEKSFAERKRMFDLPRSSWADYDKSLISTGGGVFARTLKEIPLSAAMQALIGSKATKLSPDEIIKALLKADVDLLWFGGIGTFIKAASQTNLDVGDRANDAVRVNGSDVRAKVVGEGANLGATQLGRVEYALKGGRINTDAIDNSAGVDTSDHEVNLKILFSGPLRRGEITGEARDALLNEMVDDVAALVLRDNYEQTLALSVAQLRGVADLDAHSRFIHDLERRGRLDRVVEFLPDDEALRKRAQAGRGLTRPELAVLLAYAKLDLDAEIVASDLPDNPYFSGELVAYFPRAAASRFPQELANHRLRREIIATSLANRIVNMAGPVFVHRMKEVSSAPGARVARAYVEAEGAFSLGALESRIDTLDGHVGAQTQTGMYADIAELLRRLGLWFLVNVPANADLGETIAQYREGVEKLRGTFATLVSPYEAHDTEARIAHLRDAGVPLDIAEDVSVLPLLASAPEIVMLAAARNLPIDLVAGAYFALGATIGLDRLRGLAAHISGGEHWDRLAVRRIVDDLYAGQRGLVGDALKDAGPDATTRAQGAELVKAWADARADALGRTKSFLAELERTGDLSIAKLTLANSQIHELVGR